MSNERAFEPEHRPGPASRPVLIAVLTAALSILLGCSGSLPVPTTAQPASASAQPSAASSAQPSAAGGPDIQMLGFGTAQTECKVTGQAREFQVDDPIVGVAKFIPPLAPGSMSTVRLERDGTELADFRGTIRATEPSPCVWVDLSGLEPGHYRLEVAVDPSPLPPISGEFDVVPASAEVASPAVVASASPARSPEASRTPEPDSAPTAAPVYQPIEEVEVGQCYMTIDDADDGTTLAAQLVACTEPHTSEVFLAEQLEGGADAAFPGDNEIERQVFDVCDPAFEAYVGIPYQRSRLDYVYFSPDEESWASGDRRATCVIEQEGQVVERSAKGSRQ